jgi:serine/threonine-protein kinase
LQRIAAQSHFEERYVLGDLLDQGGMGMIFRAFDKILRRDVAVKMMHHATATCFDATAVRGQFLKEARVGGRLLHPNLLAVFDLGVDRSGNIYYTMRLVDGASLQTCLDAVGKGVNARLVAYPLCRLVEALAGACRGVDFAHQNGVLHLDLKPSNVLVSGFAEVFVIDWGLARVDDVDDTERLVDLYRPQSDPALTASHTGAFGCVVGTPAYMAPEQFQGDARHFNAATDVYGLGGILHYMLYGTHPNHGDRFGNWSEASARPKTRGKLRDGLLPRGQRVRPEVQRALDALEDICLKALQPGQQDRFASAEALVIELTEWLGNTPGPPDGL